MSSLPASTLRALLLRRSAIRIVSKLTVVLVHQARGTPAAGMRVTLSRLSEDGTELTPLKDFVTNSDGRTGTALNGADFVPGVYEWVFHAGVCVQQCVCVCVCVTCSIIRCTWRSHCAAVLLLLRLQIALRW
jgi:hypothetical protein